MAEGRLLKTASSGNEGSVRSDELMLPFAAHGLQAALRLPLRVNVLGIEAVLISADSYDALAQASYKSVGRRSQIERDVELRSFVDHRCTAVEIDALRAEIVEKFGEERAPSRTALARHVRNTRLLVQKMTNVATVHPIGRD